MSSHISPLSTQIYSPQSTQSTTEFFPFVIQSEAKDLVNINVDASEILHFVQNDMKKKGDKKQNIMITKIIKQIWNQRRMNSWIFIEVIIASFFLWTVIDPMYVLMVNHFEPKGYEEDGRYVLQLGAYGKKPRET